MSGGSLRPGSALARAGLRCAALFAAMRGGPGLGVLQEMPYLLHLVGSEVAARIGDAERGPPGGQRVQREPILGEGGDAFGEEAGGKASEIGRGMGWERVCQ